MILVDSHCHLNKLEDLDSIVVRARENNVKYLQTICTNIEEFQDLIKITESYDNVFTSVGIHPDDVKSSDLCYADLVKFADHPNVIGFGETGLDYYRSTEYVDEQKHSFEQHIIASQHLELPVIVHTRNAADDTLGILNHYRKQEELKFLIHCFTESLNFASKILDLGGYISISGIVTFKNAEAIKEVVKFVPLDRLLVETDSPYLAPVPMRGKVCEPAFVIHTAKYIGELKGLTIEQVASATTDNFFQLFSKVYKSSI